jgi:scyllo-inositol 2-dehydrogenase (NADP+)
MTNASSRDPVRVALVGYGLAGQSFHAPFIASTRGMRLDAIVTRDPERRAQASREHPGARLLDGIDDVLAEADALDLVVVATPNRAHVPMARAALEAGLAVVVDKPLAPTAAEARALVALARERGRLLTVFQNRRWDGDFLTLRRLVADGMLGDVLRFESRFERWRPEPRASWKENADPAEGGGILLDLGTHLVDQAVTLLGPVSHVYAELERRRPGVVVEDDAFVALTHASGARTHVWLSAMAAQGGPRFRVLGTRAAWVKHGMDVQEAALKEGGRPREREDWGREPQAQWGRLGTDEHTSATETMAGDYGRFYRGVVQALRDGAPPPVDPGDAVRVLELLECARTSATERRVVTT